MEIILLQDVAKVGKKNDIVTVSEGYAINFLIPRGMAKAATPSAKKSIEAIKAQQSEKKDMHIQEMQECFDKVNGKSVHIKEKVNEQGHLFAALHPDNIAEAIFAQLGATVPSEYIKCEGIKAVGKTQVPIECADLKGSIDLIVESKEEK